jgi:tetratricopeptide (TPR) repeat protein
MLLKLLNAGKATQVGLALADAFVLERARMPARARAELESPRVLQRFLQRVEREARPLRLNILKRATLANSFKWRLIEQGVDRRLVDELTQALVVQLTTIGSAVAPVEPGDARSLEAAANELRDATTLFAQGNACMARGEYADAAACYEQLLTADPEHVSGRNNLGAALCRLGRYPEAEEQFRGVLGTRPHLPEAHCNLGMVLRWRGRIAESERHLRQALKLKPTYIDAQLQLSSTLLLVSRWREARTLLESVRKRAPENVAALVSLAQIAGPEGNFAEAEALLKRAIEIDPHLPAAWAGLARLRRMTPADAAWLARADEIAHRRLAPLDEADLRYAIGKYYDDIGDFKQAFRNYRRANELQKTAALPYDRSGRTRFVDAMKLAYTRALMSGPSPGSSDSTQPMFVVGMPRSGTSLVEQILASHPEVKGAGEFAFWGEALDRQQAAGGPEFPGEPLRRSLAAGYLRALASRCPRTPHIVDKTTLNSDYLGLIHAVFPHARIVYVRRSPIDTCLSCYFQQFSSEMSFALDLADLAHYYREHARLVAHWREVLPEGTLLEVQYEQLVGEQETWTRRILDFLGLAWDERCLDFHKTERAVMTASFWQVRQEIYRRSGGRWHNYKRFIGPLLELRDLEAG